MNANKKNLEFISLIVVCLAVYFPILYSDYIFHWSDHLVVINEYAGGWINARNIKMLLSGVSHGQYAPVLYNISGINLLFFHLISLTLYILLVCLVFVVILGLFNHGKLAHVFASNKNRRIVALVVTLIFAVHPLFHI